MKILTGEAKVKKGDVQCLGSSTHPERIVIRNEADLYNREKIIQKEPLDKLESEVRNLQVGVKKGEKGSKTIEPLFTSTEDRIKNIKGMIISAVSQAIREKNVTSITKLKKLVDKLANELL